MTLEEARKLISQGVSDKAGVWADIGAGTGMFTQVLMEILKEGGNGGNAENGGRHVYAVDKSPHALWGLKSTADVEVIVVEADFNKQMDLPLLDGIVMANALHYAKDHVAVLQNVLTALKPGGAFILVEYDTDRARPPWVPYPLSFETFKDLCTKAGLSTPSLIGKMDSVYGSDRIYSASAMKQ